MFKITMQDGYETARWLMVINVNLDSVGGAFELTVLTSGLERLDARGQRDTAARAGLPSPIIESEPAGHGVLLVVVAPCQLRLLAGAAGLFEVVH